MPFKKPLIFFGVGLVGLIILINASLFIVYPETQVLVLEFGEPKRVIKEPGLHWKVPFVESLVSYDKRIISLDAPPEEVITADKNRMVVDTYTRFKITDPLMFYKKSGTEERGVQLLTAQISPGLRKTLGQVEFEDVLSGKREEVMRHVQKEVAASAKDLGIEVIDVRIRKADVPKQNSESIYRRMNSERERFAKELRAKGKERAQAIKAEADRQSTVVIANANKQSQILKGEGDGEAARIYGNAFGKNPAFYKFLRALQAYEAALIQGETPLTVILDPKENEFFAHFNGTQG